MFQSGGSSGNPNPYVAAAQDFRTDIKDYISYNLNKGASGAQKFAQQFQSDLYAQERADKWHMTRWGLTEAKRAAKRAGLHPLFALGQQGVTPPPMTIPGGGSPHQSQWRPSRGSGMGGVRLATAMEKAHAEADLKLKQQQIESNDIEIMSKASNQGRLMQEMYAQPMQAEAYTAKLAEKQRHHKSVAELQRDLKDRLAVRTPAGSSIRGPWGGLWLVPSGITPVENIEPLIGEVADLWGIGIAGRMALTPEQVEKNRKDWNARVRAGERGRPKPQSRQPRRK